MTDEKTQKIHEEQTESMEIFLSKFDTGQTLPKPAGYLEENTYREFELQKIIKENTKITPRTYKKPVFDLKQINQKLESTEPSWEE